MCIRDRLELIPQPGLLLLGSPLRLDVLDHADEIFRPAFGITGERHRQRDPGRRPVLPDVALLHRERLDLSGQYPADVLHVGLEVRGMRDLLERPREQLLARVAHHLAEPSIDPEKAAVGPDMDDADRGLLERGPEPLFALVEVDRGLSLLGSVFVGAEHAEDGPARAVSYTHLRAHETVLDLVCR